MSVRDSFVAEFGEDQAVAIERAAAEHDNGVHSVRGSDPFKWAVCICIGYECVSRPEFAEYHSITVPQERFKEWCLNHGELRSHDGDVDFLSLLSGAYGGYIQTEEAGHV